MTSAAKCSLKIWNKDGLVRQINFKAPIFPDSVKSLKISGKEPHQMNSKKMGVTSQMSHNFLGIWVVLSRR